MRGGGSGERRWMCVLAQQSEGGEDNVHRVLTLSDTSTPHTYHWDQCMIHIAMFTRTVHLILLKASTVEGYPSTMYVVQVNGLQHRSTGQ